MMASRSQTHGAEEDPGEQLRSSKGTKEVVPASVDRYRSKKSVKAAVATGKLLKAIAQQKQEKIDDWIWIEEEGDRIRAE